MIIYLRFLLLGYWVSYTMLGFAAQTPSLKVGIDLTYYPYDYQENGIARGFDPELMRLIAKKLQLDVEFKDTRIENIILGLQAKHYDVVASALYINAARAKEVNFLPYLQTGGVLLVRADTLFFPKQLEQLCGKRISSMKGAAWIPTLQQLSTDYCLSNGLPSIIINEYPSAPQATQALLSGAVEVQYEDAAVASQVVQELDHRVIISSEQLFHPVLIGLAFRQDNLELYSRIQQVLQQLIDSGEYATLLQRYGLQQPDSELLNHNAASLHLKRTQMPGLDTHYLLKLFLEKEFWQAALVVLALSSLTWIIGNVIGFFLALGRLIPRGFIYHAVGGYIWFFRSIPLLVLLIFIYNLPQLWNGMHSWLAFPFVSGLLALVLSESAYLAEIHRGALQSVPIEQYQAARGLGLSNITVQWYIILPQALRNALPALTNQYVTIIKLTSLVSVISLSEILLVGQRFYTRNFLVIETLIVVAIYYVLLVSLVSIILGWVEKRLNRYILSKDN